VYSSNLDDNRQIEIMLPMRDGIELHTMIYLPKSNNNDTKFPTVIDRSPYGYYNMEYLIDILLPFGFVSIGQDMRGTEKSQGNYTMWQSDANDSQDLGDWIVKQEWSNGKIYTFGISADGIGSLQTVKNNPSWLMGQYIGAATSYMYDIFLPYGTYKQETVEYWLNGLTMPNPDVVYDNINDIYENEAYTSFWKSIELNEQDYSNINYPNAFWAGWYDIFLKGNLKTFESYNTLSNINVRYKSKIVIDPIGHCFDAGVFFTENTHNGRTALIFSQMFEVFGIHPVSRNEIKNITFYVMSSNDDIGKKSGLYWTSLESFPKPKMVDYFLNSDKTASVIPKMFDKEFTKYKVDPSNPIPTMGGNNLPDSVGGDIPCGPLDQSQIDLRSDVLTFQTNILEEELALTGPIFATLYVSSDAIDTDFMVRVSDVYPTGVVRLLQDNAIRMRWRENTLTPVYMENDEIYKIEISLWNTSYVVAPGHALRFAVSSSNWPRFSVNPQNGVLLNNSRYPGKNITTINTLYHSSKYPSKITLPIVKKNLLPEVDVIKAVQNAYPYITDEMLNTGEKYIYNMLKYKNKNKKDKKNYF
jgi:predicted acyl esterase